MSERSHPLSETQIENARPGEKVLKLFDGGGLFLQVDPKGGKLWRYKYRFEGKEKLLCIGAYPNVSLSDARLQHSEARLLLKQGTDPSAFKRALVAQNKAELAENEGKPSVRAVMDGTFEIWKDRAVLRLTLEEAQFIKSLLDKLL